ncbi:MAG: S9 family peptidase [Acidobacteriota bacterium]
MKRIVLPILIALLPFTLSADRIQFADRFRVVNVSEPQLSPDGAKIVCVVSRVNVEENRRDSELVLVDPVSGAQQSLTFERRGLAAPQWSPDARSVAFLANGSPDKDAKRQLWLLSMSGGEPRRLTDAARGVQQYGWSPDGASLAFVAADEPETRTGDDKHNLSFEVGDDDFLNTSAPTPSHVWVVAATGGKARRITSGTWSVPVAKPPGPVPSPLSWSPDGKSLAITRLATPHTGNGDSAHIEIVDVATGVTRRVTKGEPESHPQFSPDGRWLSYHAPRDGERLGENAIWVVSAQGGDAHEVTHGLDRNLSRAIWLPHGKSILTGGHDETTTSYWIQSVDGAPATRLNLGDIEPTWSFWIDASIAGNGAMAFTGQTPTRMRELYYMASVTAQPKRLTDFNAPLASLQLGRSERVTWDNEGLHEDGVVTYPPDFDASKKYPLVVYIHGGPRASSTTAVAFLPQLFASKNWIVFQPNYRGSDNLGNAYEHAIVKDAGAGPGRDVMAGIAMLKRRGFVDDDKIVVGGWSYGGYMTSWMIGHYPIFKAAVSGAAVNNLLDAYTLSDGNQGRRYSMGGSPYVGDNMKSWIEQSPITYVQKIKTPTLILSDTGDYRVPITQSYQMYHALKDNGVTVKFFAYPVGGHSPEDPVHQSDIDRRYVEWFSQYLK